MTYKRYALIPKDEVSKSMLFEFNGQKRVVPFDDYLGLSGLPFKITPAAMLKIAFWAQNQGSYQRAEDAIMEAMGIKVNDDTIRQVANYVGSKVFNADCEKANQAIAKLESGRLDFAKTKDGIVYIQTDGAALNTRIKNDANSTWRENKLGEVFSTEGIRFWNDKKGKRKHQILAKEYISYIGSAQEFKKHLFACALRGGYGKFKNTVVLSDGAAWIRSMVDELFPDAQQILDFYHLCENVNEYAKYIFKMNEVESKPWARKTCDALRNSNYQQVLHELEDLERKPRGCSVNLYGYITNNIKNIDYAAYEKQGFFIGSGAIESGNKIILQDRLKRAGMRWNIATAQAMLSLRTKAESGRWFTDVTTPFLHDCLSCSFV